MRKTTSSKPISVNQNKKDVVLCPPTPPMELKKEEKTEVIKMEEEPTNEVVKLDDIMKPISDNVINLDEDKGKKKKKKPTYDLDDNILKDIQISEEIHILLISNMNGYFIDFRKYFRGYPSQKGIRIPVGKFILAYDYLKKDIDALNLPTK